MWGEVSVWLRGIEDDWDGLDAMWRRDVGQKEGLFWRGIGGRLLTLTCVDAGTLEAGVKLCLALSRQEDQEEHLVRCTCRET